MDPRHQFCPNSDCPARGQIGKGNITSHSEVEGRYLCTVCEATFAETTGTVFYHLKTDPDRVSCVLTLIGHGCPPEAIPPAFGISVRTVRRWMEKAGVHCEGVHAHLVEQPRELGQVQADELRVKLQKQIVWVGMAIAVPSRLWLGAVTGAKRDTPLIRSLLQKVRACARFAPLLIVTDGFSAYPNAIRRAFRDPESTGKRGRPRGVAWTGRVIGQVVKRTEKRRIVEVEQRLLEGTEVEREERLKATQGGGSLNTAYIERLNATFRSRLYCLVRRTRSLARRQAMLHTGVCLIGGIYNFCSFHDTLSKEQPRTPAMAAGITDHCWSVKELLSYRVPLSPWRPPKKRGRPSREVSILLQKWAT
jgi:transposase-like protein/IS1 family transposase